MKKYRDVIKLALRKYDLLGDIVGDTYVVHTPTTIERVLPLLEKGDSIPALVKCNHRDQHGNKVAIVWAFAGYNAWPDPTFTFQAQNVTLIEEKNHASV